MHAPFDPSNKKNVHDSGPRSGVGFLILPALMVAVLITIVIIHPKASLWISQAVQAEYGGSGMPVQAVQEPDMTIPMQTVNAR